MADQPQPNPRPPEPKGPIPKGGPASTGKPGYPGSSAPIRK